MRGRITKRPLGLKRNTLLLRRRSCLLRESRQLQRAQLQPDGLPSPWPWALHRVPPVEECDEPRDRCDAGRVLSDHRVLIARSFTLGGARVESWRTAADWFVRPRDRCCCFGGGGGGLATRVQTDIIVTVSCRFKTDTDATNNTSDLSLGETTRLT